MTAPGLGMTADGRYDVYRVIAHGAMGVVYEARHQVTGRRVALKRLSPGHSHDVDLRVRFQREARVLGAVGHPFVVDIFDAYMAGDDPYIVLEYLDGCTLEGTLIARGTLPINDAIQVGIDLCAALAAIHGVGVLHRDIKPNNIFVSARSEGGYAVKLIDFGIATLEPAAPDRAQTLVSLAHPTLPGAIVGTPEYMAPEQIHGSTLDARADVYGLGATIFEMLTGRVPFSGTYPEVLVKVEAAKNQPPSVRALRPDVPEEVAQVVTKALQYDKSTRFQSAAELARALVQARAPRNRDTSGASYRGLSEPKLLLQDLSQENLAHDVTDFRRRYARVPYNTPVRVHLGDRVLDGRSENISEGGVLLITNDGCDDGAPVEVELAMPSTGTMVRVSGVTRWTRSGRTGKALGVEFGSLAPRVRDAIKSLVSRLTLGRRTVAVSSTDAP